MLQMPQPGHRHRRWRVEQLTDGCLEAAPLILRIRRATEAARARANAMKVAQQQQKVTQATRLIQTLENGMARGWAQVCELRAHGLAPQIPQAGVVGLRRIVSEASELATSDVDKLLTSRTFDMKRLERQVSEVAANLESAAQVVWRQHVEGQLPRMEELLSVLANLRAYRARVTTVRQLDSDVRGRLAQAPANADQWREAQAQIKQLRDAAGEFTAGIGADLPDAVAHFLRQAGSKTGATLNDLTDVVRDWLRAHEVESDFAVFVRGSATATGLSATMGRP